MCSSTGRGWGYFIGILSEWEGPEFLKLVQLCCLSSRSQCQESLYKAHHHHLELSFVSSVSAHGLELGVRSCCFLQGTLVWRARYKALSAATYEQVKLDEAQRKKRLDSISLSRFYFPGIVSGLCPWRYVYSKCLLNKWVHAWINEWENEWM